MPLTATRRPSAANRVSTAGGAKGAAIEIKPQSSDPGIKIKADAKNNRVILKGTAEGPRIVSHGSTFVGGGRSVPDVAYEVSRGVSFQVDHGAMPDFSRDANHSRKNAWYFSHLGSTSPRQGDTALDVARALAASLNKGGAYHAEVSEKAGAAVIQLTRL